MPGRGTMIDFASIEQTRQRIAPSVLVSPCPKSVTFSKMLGCEAYFKMENLQMTGSFKERGALNKMLSLDPAALQRGVVAASAGNHAQGVAFHATRLGARAIVVMPLPTPLIKVTATRGYGAETLLHGANFDEAYAKAKEIRDEQGMCLIPAFDDELVMMGQGTIGLEIIEQNPYLEAVIVPIGGGGLIAGMAVAIKETNPRIRVIGVQTAVLPSMKAAVEAGAPVELPPSFTLADGIAVKRCGDLTLPVVRRYVDEIVTVDDEEIATAVMLLLEREKTLVEGAGACTLAAVYHRKTNVAGKRVCMVLSGGNIDVNVLSRIIERGLVKDGRLMKLDVIIRDVPGALAELTKTLAGLKANVIEIYHNRSFANIPLGEALVQLILEARGRDHAKEIVASLRQLNYKVEQLSAGT